jgi:hypothetical protein
VILRMVVVQGEGWRCLARRKGSSSATGAIARAKGDVKFAIDGQHELDAARNARR